MSEQQSLEMTTLRVSRLASLLADAVHSANEGDEYGAPSFRRNSNRLRIAALMFADCLPSSFALSVADEVRAWCGEIDGDGAHAVAIRSLLRHLDPSGSPKV